MSSKVILLFALLAIAFAERPYVGLRVPSLPSNPLSPQVVGGSEAPKNGCPYIVSLQWSLLGIRLQHFCAGSILNSEWIVTAAHCIGGVPKIGKMVVKAGKHSINTKENTEQAIEVARSFVHEKYGNGVGPYDIALIKLKKPLEFTKEVQPIGLPEAESEPTGNSYLCGWGSTSTGRLPTMPDKLQDIELPIVDRSTCDEAVKRLTGSSPVHETNVCTGPLTGGKSACSGDSGGPLTTPKGENQVLIGIVSWGIMPCGTDGAPSVYTRVAKFNSWIQNKINNY